METLQCPVSVPYLWKQYLESGFTSSVSYPCFVKILVYFQNRGTKGERCILNTADIIWKILMHVTLPITTLRLRAGINKVTEKPENYMKLGMRSVSTLSNIISIYRSTSWHLGGKVPLKILFPLGLLAFFFVQAFSEILGGFCICLKKEKNLCLNLK